jgi:hypothetical protein
VRVERVLGRLDDVGVVGQAQVVVGAEVQHRAAVGELDLGRLRAGDDAFGLEQAGGADLVEGIGVALGQGRLGQGHVGSQFQLHTTLPRLAAFHQVEARWKSSIGNWCVSTFCSGKPVSTIWVILYQVSYIFRP